MALRFVHTSDIHLLDLRGVRPWHYLNKRVTGRLNLALRRGKKHDQSIFDHTVAAAKRLAADRLVVTGDLTNLSLDPEFALVKDKLDAAGLPVTVIPGNHDTYTRGAEAARRFEAYLAQHMEGERGAEDYPFVQRFEGVGLVGLSTAIATPPFKAWGRVGPRQLSRLAEILDALREERRARIVLIHHPVTPDASKPHKELLDRDAFARVLADHGAELILHGHEHRRIDGTLPGRDGDVVVHGIASGTALSTDPVRRASFSLYDAASSSIKRTIYQWNGTEFSEHETTEQAVAWAA